MPYIKPEDREELNAFVNYANPQNAGELNFCITKLIHNYLQTFNRSYTKFNEVVGVLECAKIELYRQIIAKYEDSKRLENGAISDLDSSNLEDVR